MNNTDKFIDWLKINMEAKNFGVRETARAAGISHPLILDAMKGKKPSYETCIALANLFKTPPEEVLRMASLLPTKPAQDVIKERAEYLMEHLSPANQKKAIDYLEFLIFQEEKGEKRGKPNRRHAKTEAD
ncbi:MAG: helix-turn-helix transcriptional regulator [Anaerolineaceae bacterium]|nr:helix-turn-helix transcriptional regulator [Anaerolineaceae bacterium]